MNLKNETWIRNLKWNSWKLPISLDHAGGGDGSLGDNRVEKQQQQQEPPGMDKNGVDLKFEKALKLAVCIRGVFQDACQKINFSFPFRYFFFLSLKQILLYFFLSLLPSPHLQRTSTRKWRDYVLFARIMSFVNISTVESK